jgi:hypothetical protein
MMVTLTTTTFNLPSPLLFRLVIEEKFYPTFRKLNNVYMLASNYIPVNRHAIAQMQRTNIVQFSNS